MDFCSEIALTKRKKRKYIEWEQNKAYLFRGSLNLKFLEHQKLREQKTDRIKAAQSLHGQFRLHGYQATHFRRHHFGDILSQFCGSHVTVT